MEICKDPTFPRGFIWVKDGRTPNKQILIRQRAGTASLTKTTSKIKLLLLLNANYEKPTIQFNRNNGQDWILKLEIKV